jgi:hypothetical protein
MRDILAGVGKAGGRRLVEQLVTQPPLQALDERIMGRLTRCHTVLFVPRLAAIFEHCARSHLGSIIAYDGA